MTMISLTLLKKKFSYSKIVLGNSLSRDLARLASTNRHRGHHDAGQGRSLTLHSNIMIRYASRLYSDDKLLCRLILVDIPSQTFPGLKGLDTLVGL